MATIETQKDVELCEISSLSEMEELKFDWSRVFHKCLNSTPFQSWEWNYGVAKTFNSSESVEILVGKNSEGEIIGIAPLKLRKYLITGLRILEFIGTRYSDYLDIIVEEKYKDKFTEELFNWIKTNKVWHIINFVSLRTETVEIFAKYFQLEFSEHMVCPYITLPNSFENFTQGISKKLYNTIRRTLNRLTAEGRLEYSILESPKDINEHINKFFELHQKRQNTKGERGHFHSKTWRKQFLELSTQLFNAHLLKVGILKIDSKFAAIHFNMIFKNKEYAYLSKYGSGTCKTKSQFFTLLFDDRRIYKKKNVHI